MIEAVYSNSSLIYFFKFLNIKIDALEKIQINAQNVNPLKIDS